MGGRCMAGKRKEEAEGDLPTPSQGVFILKSACSQPYHPSTFLLGAVNLHPGRQEGWKEPAVSRQVGIPRRRRELVEEAEAAMVDRIGFTAALVL